MQMKTKMKSKTVAEKVTDLILNPNGSVSSEDSTDASTVPKVVDFDDEYDFPDTRSTDIRKRNVKLLSEQSTRYKGKIASRKDFNESDESEDEDEYEKENKNNNESNESDSDMEYSDDDLKAYNIMKKSSRLMEVDLQEDDIGSDVSEEMQEESDDELEQSNTESDTGSENDVESDTEGTTTMISESNRQAEIQKGKHVQNQLHIWEKCLELRIHLQKLLTKSNMLPSCENMQKQQSDNEDLQNVVKESTTNISLLLKNFLDLQTTLRYQYSEMKSEMKNCLKRPLPFQNRTDIPPVKKLGEHLQTEFGDFRKYRNTVLLKWDDRTKLLAPGAGVKKNSLNEEFDILKKIDNTLINRSKLIAKSQIPKNDDRKCKHERNLLVMDINHNSNGNVKRNVNTYDDSDFYHQQLRELIEYKANTSMNMSEVTKQFVELQKLRQKMKKKVDTRASKGRKIRYAVHKKLMNFMAPYDNSTWTDESKNELYKSLFAT